MTKMNWDSVLEQQYMEVFKSFGLKYINAAIEDFNNLCNDPPTIISKEYLQKLNQVDNTKLNPFKNIGISEFAQALLELEHCKVENLNQYRQMFWESEIHRYRAEVKTLVGKKIQSNRKQKLLREFLTHVGEFSDFESLQKESVNELTEMIKKLNVDKSQHFNKSRKTIK